MIGRHRKYGRHAVWYREKYVVVLKANAFRRMWCPIPKSGFVSERLDQPDPVWDNGRATR